MHALVQPVVFGCFGGTALQKHQLLFKNKQNYLYESFQNTDYKLKLRILGTSVGIATIFTKRNAVIIGGQ